MRVDVLTLFPEVFGPFLTASIIGRAVEIGSVTVRCVDYRDFTHDRHRGVDDKPFGGGPGMVIQCGPVFEAVEFVERDSPKKPVRVMLTPQGELLNQQIAQQLAVRTGLDVREISIGDYVLSGGEPAAMVLIDAIVRLLPGVLGDARSAVEESFTDGLLEYPQYTRPREFRGMSVPDVLLSGDHARIAAWRKEQAKARTRRRRPDLFQPDDSGGQS